MTNNNINRIGLSLGSTPSSPIPIPNMTPETLKRTDNNSRPIPPTTVKKNCVEMTDAQVNEIVEMLGIILGKVKQAISEKKGKF
jgi:hypothetical protein